WRRFNMTQASKPYVTLYNNQVYNSGSYSVYIAPFNVGSLVYGKDYSETMQLDSSSPNSGVTANWSFPTITAGNIKSFLHIDYGDYNYGSPQKPIASSKIKDITTLSESINFTMSGNTQGSDVIMDLFLTKVAGQSSTNAAEVEVLLHSPTYSQTWVASLHQLGSFTTNGVTWKVAETTIAGNPDYVFMPANGADVTSGTINVNAMLQYLVAHGGLNSSLYFNGLANGVETSSGSGSWTMNNFSVDYATKAPVPTVTVGLAKQTGKTVNAIEYTYNPTLTGKADANSTVTLYDNGSVAAHVTANSSGVWTYSAASLSDGYHDLKATETNSYGNTASSSVAIQLSRTPNTINEIIQYVAGQGQNGVYSADPKIYGWTAPNTDVTISDLGKQIADVISNSSGYYSYQTTHLAPGAHDIAVSAANIYGSTAHSSLHLNFV
ncbi:MAG: Ig-like domain-containing protein, partial [Alphaproteobacteria bacterium]|nr:Ig-like domain-containing protein [Alphaproteobacteria bacterium]